MLESGRYDLTRSKWPELYKELEDAVSTFGFKTAVLIVTDIYGVHVPTEFNTIILSYKFITKAMVDSHCWILWSNNSGSGLGHHPTAYCGAAKDNPVKKPIINQLRLRSNVLALWIKISITTDTKRKLRAFSTVYTFNNQYWGATIFLPM